MNIREYIDNPMGKGNSSIPNRMVIINTLNQQYLQYRDKNIIQNKVYKHGRSYYIHVILPSVEDRGNTYDVVIEFINSIEHATEPTLINCDIRFFSNCPSFTFTFANAYDKAGLLIPELRNKYSREVFKYDPDIRNKFKIINYEKYLYFAIMNILDWKESLLNKTRLESGVGVYNFVSLKTIVRTDKQILEEIKKLNLKKKQANQSSNRNSINGKVVHKGLTGENKGINTIARIKEISSIKPKKPHKTISKMKKK